ncbi:hypothetical protein L7F22_054777 [Adiantum nelumboides]|nr:hypothetical protein [Adiantum nelumboides]
MDKAEAEEKQADTTKPKPGGIEFQIPLMQLEEPTQEEEVRIFYYNKDTLHIVWQFQCQKVVAKETDFQKERADQAYEETDNLKTALQLVTKERDSGAGIQEYSQASQKDMEDVKDFIGNEDGGGVEELGANTQRTQEDDQNVEVVVEQHDELSEGKHDDEVTKGHHDDDVTEGQHDEEEGQHDDEVTEGQHDEEEGQHDDEVTEGQQDDEATPTLIPITIVPTHPADDILSPPADRRCKPSQHHENPLVAEATKLSCSHEIEDSVADQDEPLCTPDQAYDAPIAPQPLAANAVLVMPLAHTRSAHVGEILTHHLAAVDDIGTALHAFNGPSTLARCSPFKHEGPKVAQSLPCSPLMIDTLPANTAPFASSCLATDADYNGEATMVKAFLGNLEFGDPITDEDPATDLNVDNNHTVPDATAIDNPNAAIAITLAEDVGVVVQSTHARHVAGVACPIYHACHSREPIVLVQSTQADLADNTHPASPCKLLHNFFVLLPAMSHFFPTTMLQWTNLSKHGRLLQKPPTMAHPFMLPPSRPPTQANGTRISFFHAVRPAPMPYTDEDTVAICHGLIHPCTTCCRRACQSCHPCHATKPITLVQSTRMDLADDTHLAYPMQALTQPLCVATCDDDPLLSNHRAPMDKPKQAWP